MQARDEVFVANQTHNSMTDPAIPAFRFFHHCSFENDGIHRPRVRRTRDKREDEFQASQRKHTGTSERYGFVIETYRHTGAEASSPVSAYRASPRPTAGIASGEHPATISPAAFLRDLQAKPSDSPCPILVILMMALFRTQRPLPVS